MSILDEFKAFIAKGNVMDLAVGVIIGGAFSDIVSHLVKDVIMPAVGMIGARPDFSSIAIGAHEVTTNGVTTLQGGIMIGNFMNAVVSFLILAAVVFFFLVKPMNVLMAKINKPVPPPDTPAPPEDIILLREIRDSLKKPA
jgi:large conductance mechanosensitive channel